MSCPEDVTDPLPGGPPSIRGIMKAPASEHPAVAIDMLLVDGKIACEREVRP
jgi:hypothetical protein